MPDLFVWVGGVGKVLVTLLKDKKANTIPTPFKKSRRENFLVKISEFLRFSQNLEMFSNIGLIELTKLSITQKTGLGKYKFMIPLIRKSTPQEVGLNLTNILL